MIKKFVFVNKLSEAFEKARPSNTTIRVLKVLSAWKSRIEVLLSIRKGYPTLICISHSCNCFIVVMQCGFRTCESVRTGAILCSALFIFFLSLNPCSDVTDFISVQFSKYIVNSYFSVALPDPVLKELESYHMTPYQKNLEETCKIG